MHTHTRAHAAIGCLCSPSSPDPTQIVRLPISLQWGQFTSPDYPEPYCELANCRWLIQADERHNVQIQVGRTRALPQCVLACRLPH
jgi:hypothetical protein